MPAIGFAAAEKKNSALWPQSSVDDCQGGLGPEQIQPPASGSGSTGGPETVPILNLEASEPVKVRNVQFAQHREE